VLLKYTLKAKLSKSFGA